MPPGPLSPLPPTPPPGEGENGNVPFSEAVRVWTRVALQSFGGPAGQIAVMHRILVEEKKWVSEERFLHALNYCMLLPGPEAQQLATYIGWLLHRTPGGLVAGIFFVLPGLVAILALSILYVTYRQVGFVQGLLFGLKPAVMAVVIEAVFRIGKKALKNEVLAGLAAAAFVAIFFLEVPFPWIVLGAGAAGFLGGRVRPDLFLPAAPAATSDILTVHVRPSARRALKILTVCLLLWLLPLLGLAAAFGSDSVFVEEGIFFSKMAVVTFGGAYAVLAYVGQAAVETYGWLAPGEMLDGLGLAETTPGPLIMVLQFVGFLGAYRNPGGLAPLAAGVLGSLVTVWVTFVPCFLWIFLGAPYIERLRGNRALASALSGITAAVVGVILNLAVWFSLHTLFGEIGETHRFGVRLLVPDWSTLSPGALAIAVFAFLALFRWKLGMGKTLALSAAAGVVYGWWV